MFSFVMKYRLVAYIGVISFSRLYKKAAFLVTSSAIVINLNFHETYITMILSDLS